MSSINFPTALGGDGNDYSDDGTATRDMQNGGHRDWFLPMLGQVIAMANSAATSAANAVGSANAAGTSTTSITPTIGSDTATITTQSGKTWAVGQVLMLADATSPGTKWFTGFVKSYSSTSLVVTVIDAQGGAGANWSITLLGGGSPRAQSMTINGQSATSYTVATTDRGKLIRHSGTANTTYSFTAAATLGAGWYCFIENAMSLTSGYRMILDPNSTEQIDGVTSLSLYPGAVRMVICDGAAFRTIPLKGGVAVFTSSGTFYPTPNALYDVYLRGGGASGAGGATGNAAATVSGGGGGGGGQGLMATIASSDLTAAGEAITIAAAQTSVGAGSSTSSTTAGTAGNNSTFAELIAYGGGAPTHTTYGLGGIGAHAVGATPATPTQIIHNIGGGWCNTSGDYSWAGGAGYAAGAGGSSAAGYAGGAGGVGQRGGAGGGGGGNRVSSTSYAAGAAAASQYQPMALGGGSSGAGGAASTSAAGTAGSNGAANSGGGGGGGGAGTNTSGGTGGAGGQGGSGLGIIFERV